MFTNPDKIQDVTRSLLLFGLGIPFILIFAPFFVPMLMAMFVAFGLEPVWSKIKFRTKKRKYFASGLLVLLFLTFLVPFVAFVVRIGEGLKSLSADTIKNSQFFQAIFDLWEKVQSYTSHLTQMFGLEHDILPSKDVLFGKITPIIVDNTTLFFKALPDLGLSLFVFFCFLFVLITNAAVIKRKTLELNILPDEEVNHIIQLLKDSCSMILVSTILIGALQASIVALGSLIFGFHELFLIFVLTFVVSFIPVIGAAPVAILLALISFITGHAGNGIGLTVVALIAGTIDNIVKPLVFSKEDEGLHPVVSLLGIIGAIIVFGLPGLLLGPLIMQASLRLIPLLMQKLLKTLRVR